MKRSDDSLERGLQAAFPPKNTPEEFKMELKYRLMDNYAVRRRRSRPYGVWLGLAAALLLSIGYLAWPLLFPVELPQLPSLASTGRETQGASAGPGFEVALDYRLTGTLTSLPRQAPVYRYAAVPFSAAAVEQLAANLGLSGQAAKQAWQDSFTYSVETGERQLIAFPDGYHNYFRPYPRLGLTYGSEAQLVACAKDFLPRIGIDPESVRLLRVEAGSEDTPASVTFVPVAFSNQVSAAPYVRISVGADQQIYGAGWVWPDDLQSSLAYRTRSVEQAWADVQAGGGKLFLEYNLLQGPVSGDVLHGNAEITAVTVGYVLTYDQNGDPVMQPVAAFSGQASFADGSVVPVTVYTALLADSYYHE